MREAPAGDPAGGRIADRGDDRAVMKSSGVLVLCFGRQEGSLGILFAIF